MRQFIICDVLDISKHCQVEEMYNNILNNYIDENQEKILLEDIEKKFLNSNIIYLINYNGIYDIGKAFKILEKNYFIGLYDNYYYERDALFKDIAPELSNLFKIEVIPGKLHKYFKYKAEVDTVIPIMKIEEGSTIEIFINKEKYNFNSLLYNRFYYYKVKSGYEVLIKSNKNFIIGDIIKLKLNESKPKLILNIFIDGLSQKFIEKNKLEEIMPNL